MTLVAAMLVVCLLPCPAQVVAPSEPSTAPEKSATSPQSQPPVPQLPPLTNLSAFQGMQVQSVRFRGVQGDARILSQIRELITQKAGQSFDPVKVRESVENLYATGRFAYIQVEAKRESGEQLSLVFGVAPNYFVGSVTSEGAPSKQRPNNSQVVDASKLQLGEVLTQGKIDQAVQRIRTLLEVNGFYRAKVDHSETYDEKTQVAAVHFLVTPGAPAQIGTLRVEGDPGYSTEQIASMSGLTTGRAVSQERLNKAQQKLRKVYSKQNRLESQISIIERNYHADTNQLDLVFRIERGPTVDVAMEGTAISKGKLKSLVPVFEEHAVDNDLLNEGRRNIRDYLQSEGYFDAKVNYSEDFDQQQNHLKVIFDADHGEKHDVVKVNFEIKAGEYLPAVKKQAPYFKTEDLLERLQVQSRTSPILQGRVRSALRGLVATHGRFSQRMMSDDVDSLSALYRSNGFLQVKVEGVVQDNYQGNPVNIAVTYKIDEGPQTGVGHLTIEGSQALSADLISSDLNTVVGEPYSEANINSDRDLILNRYFDKGFPNARFDSKVTPTPEKPNSMDVVYVIGEGEQFFVDRVLMSQLRYTRPSVAEKQFAIDPGDPLSEAKMAQTQANLYDLGVFNEVKVGVQNPDGNSKYKDVLLQLQEAKRWTYTYGFGLEASSGQPSASDCQKLAEQGQSSIACSQGQYGVSPRVLFDVSRINFRGRAHTLTLQTSVGRLEQRGLANDEVRRFFDKPNWVFNATIFYDNAVNVTTYTSQRLEGSLQLEQSYSRVTRFIYRFNYRRVRATNVVVAPNQIPIYSAPVRVGIPSFSWIRDKRDNLIDTHNGNFTTADFGLASKYFGSQASFGRFLLQNSTYQSFGRKITGGQVRTWVFARQTEIGVAEPFANTTIPLPERFLAGGANTLRGFALNQAGPRDLATGNPLGGNGLFINSLELRTPPVVLPLVADNLSFVFFNDIGNVFDTASDMFQNLWRFSQQNAQQCGTNPNVCNFSYMSNAVGSGVRYRTPIGPVRVDFGYNLNPTIYPLANTINNVTTYTSATTRRLNFFFSIGQTF